MATGAFLLERNGDRRRPLGHLPARRRNCRPRAAPGQLLALGKDPPGGGRPAFARENSRKQLPPRGVCSLSCGSPGHTRTDGGGTPFPPLPSVTEISEGAGTGHK